MTPALLIAGPTAAGKTALAIAAARAVDGEIVNADSMQIYRGLQVITAAPDAAEQANIPHHLFAIADPSERWSVGRWSEAALAVMSEIRGRGKVPVLVGGTGLYFSALTRGLAPVPEIGEAARERAQSVLDERGMDALRAEAERLDPEAAAGIETGDRQRLLRVLEVAYQTGRPLSGWRRDTRPLLEDGAWFGLVIEPDRSALYARIEARFDAMLDAGALDEVKAVMARDLPPDLPAMKALGVPPLMAYLRGETGLEEAKSTAKRDSRRYAKRQMTWFRNQTGDWPRIDTLDPDVAQVQLSEILAGPAFLRPRGAVQS